MHGISDLRKSTQKGIGIPESNEDMPRKLLCSTTSLEQEATLALNL